MIKIYYILETIVNQYFNERCRSIFVILTTYIISKLLIGSGTKTVISSMLMSLSSQEDRNPPIEEPIELPVQTGSIESNTEDAVNADTIHFTPGTKDKLHGFFDREISQIEKDSEMNTFFENLSHIKERVMGNIIEAMSNEKIRELVIEVARDGRYKMKIVPIDIWDFGGQKDYYMTHQLFITSRGIFVLMFNGSQNMHQHMSDLSFLPGHYGKPTIAGKFHLSLIFEVKGG